MLFVLDSSILEMDVKCVKQNMALETLICAYQKGDHLLFSDMKVMDKLKVLVADFLSFSSRAVLNALHNRLPQYQPLTKLIDYKVIVYIESEFKKSIFRLGNEWHVPLQTFSNFGLVSTAILGENEIDSELYVIFAEHYAEKTKIRGFPPVARVRGGGGSGTPKALASYLRTEFSPCLCITDSDKLHPAYRESATSKKCSLISSSVKLRVVEHFSLEEREAENILPIDVLKKVSTIDDFLRKIIPGIFPNEESIKYVDLKNGIRLEWVVKQDAATQTYWNKANVFLANRRKVCTFCKKLSDEDKAKCSCGWISGLGDQVLSNAVAHLNSRERRLNLRDLETDSRWLKIGKKVYEFSIAPGRDVSFI